MVTKEFYIDWKAENIDNLQEAFIEQFTKAELMEYILENDEEFFDSDKFETYCEDEFGDEYDE